MTDKTDKALEEYLDGESSVSRGYARLGALQPPATLDRAILAAASDAVAREEDATVVRVRRFRRWSISAAMAATVVVAVPLVVRVIDLRINEPQPVLESDVAAARGDAPVGLELIAPAGLTDAASPVAAAARQSEPAPSVAMPQGASPGTLPAPAASPNSAVAGNVDRPSAPARSAQPHEKVRQNVYDGSPDAEFAPVLTEATEDTLARLREQKRASTEQVASVRREQSERDANDKTTMGGSASPARALANEPRPDDLAGTGAQPDYLDPRSFVQRIMGLYRSDLKRAARREFGEFLTLYPEAELPDNFPLERSEAIYPQRKIIREADDWLREIAGLAGAGRIDAARQELAKFFEIFPDYELPNWFPLTRADAAPIER